MDKTHTAVIQEYFSSLGKLSASKLTPQERKDRATKAAVTRWANVRGDVSTLPTVSIALPTVSTSWSANQKCAICQVRENKHLGLEFDTYHKNHGDWHPFSRAI